MSPSSLLFYIGVNRKVSGILHHNLFFDEPFDRHATEIYDTPSWPVNPLFYLCCTSSTDASVAPEGKENLFILIPVATGLTSNESDRMRYLKMCLDRIKKHTGEDIEGDIEYVRSYAHEEFIHDYNAFKGNAYGLANTLMQTAIMKPRMRSKKVKNLFFTGQLTVPGPGVPPSIISGQIVADEVEKYFQKR
jgi:phytoene desaturase